MAERPRALINPAALVWAREVRGMPISAASARIGVSHERLTSFEEGELQPTIPQLRTIARVYRKPSAFFYLRELPPHPPRPRDFRRVMSAETISPELGDAITRARQRRADALELTRIVGHDPPKFEVVGSTEVPTLEFAKSIRDRLGVSIEEQQRWRDSYRALRAWTAAVESAGILVSQFSDVPVGEARGFSLGGNGLPLIALNGKDAPNGKIFTLLHEVAHLALGVTGVCDLHERGEDDQSRIEVFCNQVAADALVPSSHLLEQGSVLSHRGEEWNDAELRTLAIQYSVSEEVILRRLLTLHRTSRAFYLAKRDEFARRHESEAPGGFLPYYRRVIRDNGPTFTTLALEAYNAESISALELCRVLGGIKVRHFSDIAGALEGGAA